MSASFFESINNNQTYTTKLICSLASGSRVCDILKIKPISYVKKHLVETQNHLESVLNSRSEAMFEILIKEHFSSLTPSRARPYKILAEMTALKEEVNLIFFNGKSMFIKNYFKSNTKYIIYGRLDETKYGFTISHPRIEKETKNGDLEAKYPLTGSLTQAVVKSYIKKYLSFIDQKDWLSETNLELISLKDALIQLHFPKTEEEITKAIERLAFDEILAKSLAEKYANFVVKKSTGRIIHTDKNLIKEARATLSFNLTECQENAIKDIITDQESAKVLTRMLHGDVGSGKSIVAILTSLNTVEAGFQAAIMAPTFILAKQLFFECKKICDKLKINVVFMSGKDTAKTRRQNLEQVSTGKAQIICGTHALFTEDVEFCNLGFVVIDEQHRFGTEQRMSLALKGSKDGVVPKILFMSATPIPRSLFMALYGDLNLSYLKYKPPGRKQINTVITSKTKLEELVIGLKRKIDAGAKIYWICPLIEESDVAKGTSISERHKYLCKYFKSEDIEVMHGKLKEKEKEECMQNFLSGTAKVLLATTVVEVGVNVPDATIIVIENAETFGLATLHQLRGRVGRSDLESFCILLHGKVSQETLKRLVILKNHDSGFDIAEEDMKMRGFGSIFGKMQSGFNDYTFFSTDTKPEIPMLAKKLANEIFETDPNLKENPEIKNLMKFYNYDKYIHYILH